MPGEVLLRDVSEDDLPIFFEHQRDPEATQMAAFPARAWDEFMAHWGRILADDSVIKKSVLFDGQVAGNVVSFENAGRREVGYWIGRSFWGQGIATQALSGFLSLLHPRPLFAHVAKHNLASMRVLEKCGFTVCGEDKSPASAFGEEFDEFVFVLGESGKGVAE